MLKIRRPLTGVTIFSLLLPVVWLAGSDGAWCLDMRSTNGMTRCYRPLQQKWRPPCATRGFVYVSLLCLHVRISWKRTSNYSPHKIKVLVSLNRRGENSGSKDSSIEGESWRESWTESYWDGPLALVPGQFHKDDYFFFIHHQKVILKKKKKFSHSLTFGTPSDHMLEGIWSNHWLYCPAV